MDFDKLANESLSALPDRLETADTNWAGVGVLQGNLGVQAATFSIQSLGQLNAAGVTVTQINV
jgi:hypothetical protein